MFLEKVKKEIIEKKLLKQGDRVVVGVSGGADSVCLLISLFELQKEFGYEIIVAHVNHGKRGKEADADEEFVKELCQKLGLRCVSKKIDAHKIAKEEGLSEEEAGRKERYEFFRSIVPGSKIAVAHNQSDQAETVLFNAVRGSSLAGLAGMKEISGDIIRPFLNISRDEIEGFLREKGQEFVTDKTNLENFYSRNKIRHDVLPYLKEEINKGAEQHLISLAKKAREADEYIAGESKKFVLEHNIIGDDRADIELDKLNEQGDLLKKRIIYDCICEIAKSKKDIEETHVKAVLDLIEKKVSSKANLPYGVIARRDYEKIIIEKDDAEIIAPDLTVPNKELRSAKIFSYKKEMIIPEKEYTKWFDYDKIKSGLIWRFREEGDEISLAKTGCKKISRFMIDEKIPSDKRDVFPLLADGKNILWIPGYRINENYKITDKTEKVIEITWRRDL